MTGPTHGLLSEPLIAVRYAEGDSARLTLPEVFEALGVDDRIASFTHLQAHQSQPWYCFLCQLAAIVLARAGRGQFDVEEADRWEELLLSLTGGARRPWFLVVPDLSHPAFFQPPVPEGDMSVFGEHHEHPDDLDLLVTAKNHDVKLARITRPAPDHWIFALVSLQTMEGYSGRGNYGIVRMSSGYSCRPLVGMAPGLGWGERFRRDVEVLLEQRAVIAERHGYDAACGLALTYLLPWDGKTALPLESLDPYFLEICRRIRFEDVDDKIRARRTTTSSQRIDDADAGGNVGDPWIPIRRAAGEALNVTGSGINYEMVTDILLTGEFERGAAARIYPKDADKLFLVVQALSRGQGGTKGLHERLVSVPGHVRRRLTQKQKRKTLARRAEGRIEFVSKTWRSALRPALCALYQGDPQNLDFRDERPRPWRKHLEQRVDGIFFRRLWEQAELSTEEAERAWRQEVLDLTGELLEEAIRRAAVPEPRRYRCWAAAERIFGGARNRLLGTEPVQKEATTV